MNSANRWPIVKLADVAEQCLGKMLDAKKNKGNRHPYLRNPNVRWFDVDTSDLQEMPFEEHEFDRFGLREGDVVVCEGGEAGRAAIWDGRLPGMKFQKAIHRVRCSPKLYNRFLVHRLMADYKSGRLSDYYTGATIKHLTGQDLARYEFALPPIAEQRRIAEVLDRAEALRAKRIASVANLDTLKQAIFLDLFGERHSFPHNSLEDLCDLITDGTHYTPQYSEIGTPFLSARNVTSGYIDWNRIKFIPESLHRELHKRVSPRMDDILLAKNGTTGVAAVVDRDWTFDIYVSLALLRPSRRLLPVYLHAALNSPLCSRQFTAALKGIGVPNLHLKEIRRTRIPEPPLSLQHEFALRISAVERLKAVQTASLAKLDELFASLQHRAFRGELFGDTTHDEPLQLSIPGL